ncbi:MAG TPA: YeeE/YedE family protein [Rhodocyclaceae bacterium]
MQIAWEQFTPYLSLGGGLLIGLAAAVLLLFNGRIAGISGIVGGLFQGGDRAWRAAFILGLLLAPGIWVLFAPLPATDVAGTPLLLIVAGLLVGFGSRLGSGCTSGHGVCGLSRLSLRSLVATLSFMGAAMATVFVARHLL